MPQARSLPAGPPTIPGGSLALQTARKREGRRIRPWNPLTFYRAAGGIGPETNIQIKQGHKAPNQDPERNEIRGTKNKTDVQRPNKENSNTTTRPQRVEQEESCLTQYNPKDECPE